jgi:hypothetical protein
MPFSPSKVCWTTWVWGIINVLSIIVKSRHGWVDQNSTKKTLPKVYHALQCAQCWHMMIGWYLSILIKKNSICDLPIAKVNDLYMSTKILFKKPFKYYGCLKIGCVFSTFKSAQCKYLQFI